MYWKFEFAICNLLRNHPKWKQWHHHHPPQSWHEVAFPSFQRACNFVPGLRTLTAGMLCFVQWSGGQLLIVHIREVFWILLFDASLTFWCSLVFLILFQLISYQELLSGAKNLIVNCVFCEGIVFGDFSSKYLVCGSHVEIGVSEAEEGWMEHLSGFALDVWLITWFTLTRSTLRPKNMFFSCLHSAWWQNEPKGPQKVLLVAWNTSILFLSHCSFWYSMCADSDLFRAVRSLADWS